jgi:beta-galactosidase
VTCRREAATPRRPPAGSRGPRPPRRAQRGPLSGPWRFRGSDDLAGAEAPGYDDRDWAEVTVPHTWGDRPLRRAWYRTRFPLSLAEAGRPLYLVFEGAATFADVYLNGTHLGQHRGAFTRFVFDAGRAAVAGDNVLAVRLTTDPVETADSLPSGEGKQLYRLYGGLYRKVWRLTTDPLHVDPTEDASPGVYVDASDVTAQQADVAVKVLVRNADRRRRPVTVRCRLLDAAGVPVAVLERRLEVDAGTAAPVTVAAKLLQPRLWSPADPYLYRVRTEVLDEGRLADAVEQRVGLRDFRLENGRFLLNGAAIALRGVGKHQETEEHATAVGDDELREDFARLKDLGVNRLAHHPHAALSTTRGSWGPRWRRTPSTPADRGHHDTITREMVRRERNHPADRDVVGGNEASVR